MSLFGIANFALAQPAPPKSPLLQRAPHLASWTIATSFAETTKKPGQNEDQPFKPDPGFPKNVVVTKSNKTYHEQTTFFSGLAEDKWIFDGAQLRSVPPTNVVVYVPEPDPDHPRPDYSDYTKSDFPELSWISIENYKGIQNYQGKPCYAFESTDSAGYKLTALLSDAQLPVYTTHGIIGRIYIFNAPPTSPLSPPQNFQAALDLHRRGMQALQRRSNTP